MPPEIVTRSYEPGDEQRLVDMWNEILPYDSISMKVFERKVLLDPNFDPDGLRIAVMDEEFVGFCLGITRKYPLYYEGMEPEKGWITAVGFKRNQVDHEVGHRLVKDALGFFARNGTKEVWVSPYTPNYFVLGIDQDRYPGTVELLEHEGFTKEGEIVSMDLQLWPDYQVPIGVRELEAKLRKENGIEIKYLETRYIHPFLCFLKEEFSADWYGHGLEMLQRGCDKDQIVIATRGNEVVGYCQYWNNEEYDWHRPGTHFGPFGVKETLRGKGLGSVLLARCLQDMRSRGVHHAFLLGAEEAPQRLYSRFGFKETRKYYIMKKVLR